MKFLNLVLFHLFLKPWTGFYIFVLRVTPEQFSLFHLTPSHTNPFLMPLQYKLPKSHLQSSPAQKPDMIRIKVQQPERSLSFQMYLFLYPEWAFCSSHSNPFTIL